jgi:multicomponent Na+:H+ antiporter subunit B
MTDQETTDGREGIDTDAPVAEGTPPRTDGGKSENDTGVPLASSGPAYEHRTTVIARTATRVAVPIILVTALALLFQGHNLPGGGFIGAVLTATAAVLVYVVFGLEFVQTHLFELESSPNESHALTNRYRWLFAAGLALAVVSGLAPVLAGFPFLTQAVAVPEHLPIYGELEVASALAFDLGVFFTVIGALLTIGAEVGSE